MQHPLLNTEGSFLPGSTWILPSARDQPVSHGTGQIWSAGVSPESFRALCTPKQNNPCQRYKAIILSKATHSSFVFLRTLCAFYFTSSSSDLQMWNFKCRVLKKKQHENYRALQSSTMCLQFYKRRAEIILHFTYRHPCDKKKNNNLFHKKKSKIAICV